MKTKRSKVVRKTWSITEIAGAIGVSRQMIDKLLRQGRIPASVFTSKGGKVKRKIRDTPVLRKWMASPNQTRRLSVPPKTPQGEESPGWVALQKIARLKKSLDKANQDALQAIQRAGGIAREAVAVIGVLENLLPRDVCMEQLKDKKIMPDDLWRMGAVPAVPEILTPQYIASVLYATGAVNRKPKDGEKIHEKPTRVEMFINFRMAWNEHLAKVGKLHPGDGTADEKRKIARQLKPMKEYFDLLESTEQPK